MQAGLMLPGSVKGDSTRGGREGGRGEMERQRREKRGERKTTSCWPEFLVYNNDDARRMFLMIVTAAGLMSIANEDTSKLLFIVNHQMKTLLYTYTE